MIANGAAGSMSTGSGSFCIRCSRHSMHRVVRNALPSDRSRIHPWHALVLLNDPTFVEAARAFATQSLNSDSTTDDERIAWAFYHAVTRYPTASEQGVLRRLLRENRDSFEMRPDAPAALLACRPDKACRQSGYREVAAWTAVCRAILNLAETNTRN